MNIKTTFTLSVFSLCLLLSLNAPAIAQSTPEIAGFTLVRADTGATLLELPPDGATINLAQLPTRALNIRAVTAPAAVKKVAFTVNEKSTGTDSKDPYALYQRDGNRYASWTPQAGIYVVTATPYDAASGAPGMPQTLYLTVVDDASSAAPSPTPGPAATAEPTPEPQPTAAPELPASAQPEIAAFVLVRADTGETLAGPLPDTTEVDLCQLPVRTINVRALTTPELVKHVVFHINGTQVAADARAPYALYPRDGNRYKLWTPSPGSYHIRALPYDAVTGQSGSSRSFVLSVTDSCPPLPPPEPTPEATPQPAPSSSPSPMPSASPSPTPALPGIPVFPGAAGFGTRTPAGSGRHQTPPSAAIYRVNSLADRGSGTLRQCVEAAGARTCVFEVSGRIELASELRAVNPFLTIAGQTAPAPGILLSGGPLRIAAPEVLVQHLQVRAGDAVTGPNPASRDSVAVIAPSTPVYNVVLDHLSASWGIDEN
ncbi:MAG TPA: hypothetical protein PLP17_11480, partial [Oligoflexia bacterium]|nr:hypothetical protein [Oligoflexia bacterium]